MLLLIVLDALHTQNVVVVVGRPPHTVCCVFNTPTPPTDRGDMRRWWCFRVNRTEKGGGGGERPRNGTNQLLLLLAKLDVPGRTPGQAEESVDDVDENGRGRLVRMLPNLFIAEEIHHQPAAAEKLKQKHQK